MRLFQISTSRANLNNIDSLLFSFSKEIHSSFPVLDQLRRTAQLKMERNANTPLKSHFENVYPLTTSGHGHSQETWAAWSQVVFQ